MSWPFRRRGSPPPSRLPHAYPMATDGAGDEELDAVALLTEFACSTCGRTDLPEAGDWDPPICAECDAAINFDALADELDDHARD